MVFALPRRPVGAGQAGKGSAAQAAGRGEDGVALRRMAAESELRIHDAAGQRGRAADIGERRCRWIDLNQIDCARREGEVAMDGQVACAGLQRAARIDVDTGERAGAGERAAIDVPLLALTEATGRSPAAADDVEGGETGILRSDRAQIERARAAATELEGVALPAPSTSPVMR